MVIPLPTTPFVPLSGALSWIAFGDWSNSDIHWQDYPAAKQRFENALISFLNAAITGAIKVRGKLVPDHTSDPKISNTIDIPSECFHDFRQFDQNFCGLRVGRGLFGYATQDGASFDHAHYSLGRKEFYRDVVVCRDALISHFPASLVGVNVPQEHVVSWCEEWIANGRGRNGNKAWKEFSQLPEFKGCSRDDVFRPAWDQAKRIKKQ